jgi:hypothetical protein
MAAVTTTPTMLTGVVQVPATNMEDANPDPARGPANSTAARRARARAVAPSGALVAIQEGMVKNVAMKASSPHMGARRARMVVSLEAMVLVKNRLATAVVRSHLVMDPVSKSPTVVVVATSVRKNMEPAACPAVSRKNSLRAMAALVRTRTSMAPGGKSMALEDTEALAAATETRATEGGIRHAGCAEID